MDSKKDRIDEAKKRISYLYHYNIDVNVAIKLMQDRDINDEFIMDIYRQLSTEVEKLMEERFYCYTIKDNINDYFDIIDFWTSRYILTYRNYSPKSTFHGIKIFDSFNDKSM
jgi:hypothetical protein